MYLTFKSRLLRPISMLAFAPILLSGCREQVQLSEEVAFEKEVRQLATSYFETFAAREDWAAFCVFYAEDVHFRDIILQLELDSLWQLKRFYNWEGEGDRFRKLSPDQKHLELESLVVEGHTAVGSGHLNPFYYDGNLIDTDWGMAFTIWLTFNEELKIIAQRDWFEYDPYTLESTVQRCRENGFEATPEWLDLTR